jgi:hypothetical protein
VTHIFSLGRRNTKILLCAPSNCAIDEVTVRLISRIKTLEREAERTGGGEGGKSLKILRIGDVENSVKAIQEVSLDALSQAHKESDKDGASGTAHLDEKIRERTAHREALRKLLDDAHQKKKILEEKDDKEKDANELESVKKNIRELTAEKNEVSFSLSS